MTRSVRIKAPPTCPRCASALLKKNGSYAKKRSRVKVQRFLCLSCHRTFIPEAPHYKQKRPDLNEKIFHLLCNGVGIRRIAQILSITPRTVQKKIKVLAVLCDSFQNTHMGKWTKEPVFQFDEMWSLENGGLNALTIAVAVEKESYFLVWSRSAHTNSNKGTPTERNKADKKRRHKLGFRLTEICRVLSKCHQMKPHGKMVVMTDKKIEYERLLQRMFGPRLVHLRYNAGDEEELKKLFPINNTMACMRAEMAKLRRRGWYLTKDNMWLNAHLAIYAVYYNYFRVKAYTIPPAECPVVVSPPPEVVDESGVSKKPKKPKKYFKRETPAMRLGIFDKPLTFKFLMENFGPKYIPVAGRSAEVVPLGHQLPLRKAS